MKRLNPSIFKFSLIALIVIGLVGLVAVILLAASKPSFVSEGEAIGALLFAGVAVVAWGWLELETK